MLQFRRQGWEMVGVGPRVVYGSLQGFTIEWPAGRSIYGVTTKFES